MAWTVFRPYGRISVHIYLPQSRWAIAPDDTVGVDAPKATAKGLLSVPRLHRQIPMATEEKVAELRRRKGEAILGGGKERIDAQPNQGKYRALERIDVV